MGRIKIISLVAAVTVITSWSALIFVGSSQEDSKKNAATKTTYEFKQLGEKCESYAFVARQQSEQIKNTAETDYKSILQRIDSLEAQAYSRQSSNTSVLNQARSDYFEIYLQGGMTKSEYEQKMDDLDEAQSKYDNSEIIAEANRIRREADEIYKAEIEKANDLKSSAVALESCSESADSKRNFTPSGVARFESLMQTL